MKNYLLLLLAVLSYAYINAQCGSPSYADPQFTMSVQNPACPTVGEIRVLTASDGVAPYTFTLLPNNIINSSGLFSNLPAGNYIVQMKDACGNIRSRQATITPYIFTSSSSVASLGCRNFQFSIGCSASGPSLQYGYSLDGGSTVTWGDSADLHLILSTHTLVHLYVKDSCGNQAETTQNITQEMMGYIKELQEGIACSYQEIYPVYYGFNAPQVCLYLSPQNTLVQCKQAPAGYTGGSLTNFLHLPFGQDYYVIVEDGCYRDSAFFKDKRSKGGVELNPFRWGCNDFDLHVDGNNSGIVCLYNAKNDSLIDCRATNDTAINPRSGLPWTNGGAEWYNLPYGEYYSFIYDPCSDSLIRVDSIVSYPRNPGARMYYNCSVYKSAIGATYLPESPQPYLTSIYYPDGTLAATYPYGGYLLYPTWPTGGTITVVQQDGCGHRDTSYAQQPLFLPSRSIVFKGGCPSITGPSGGGDIILSGNPLAYGSTSNFVTAAPLSIITIIKKDSLPVSIPQNYTQWNPLTNLQDFYFTNLATGVYIIESLIGCESARVYDTVEIKPYAYPLQEQTHVVQCGNNPYVFKDTTSGGVGPFSYEIIATSPSLPSLLTGVQSSNLFAIPPGTNINTITIQVIDACGNSETKVFPVTHAPDCTTLAIDSIITRVPSGSKPITIFPNPSGKQFTIAFSQKKKTDYQIEIYTIAGLKMYTKSLKDVDTKTFVINQSLPAGTYVVQVIDKKSGKQYYHKQVIL